MSAITAITGQITVSRANEFITIYRTVSDLQDAFDDAPVGAHVTLHPGDFSNEGTFEVRPNVFCTILPGANVTEGQINGNRENVKNLNYEFFDTVWDASKLSGVDLSQDPISNNDLIYFDGTDWSYQAVSDFANLFDGRSTDDLDEGSTNLYFQDARAITALEQITLFLNPGANLTGGGAFNIIDQTVISIDLSDNVDVQGTLNVQGNTTLEGRAEFEDDVEITGDLLVLGDFQIEGTTTVINSTQVNVGDNQIRLNANHTGTPTLDAGIQIERGTSSDAQIQWDEANEYWAAGILGDTQRLLREEDLFDINTVTTDDLAEGTNNLYFTDARAVGAIKSDADWNADDWDEAFGWGDHAQVGYLTSIPSTFLESGDNVSELTNDAGYITSAAIDPNWDTAYDRSATDVTLETFANRSITVTIQRENEPDLSSNTSFSEFGVTDVTFTDQNLLESSNVEFARIDSSSIFRNTTFGSSNNEFRRSRFQYTPSNVNSISDLTNSGANQDTDWSFAQSNQMIIVNSSSASAEAMAFIVPASTTEAAIQVGRLGLNTDLGTLHLNPLGAEVRTGGNMFVDGDLEITGDLIGVTTGGGGDPVTGVSVTGDGNSTLEVEVTLDSGATISDSTSTSHNHSANDITSGTLSTARLPTITTSEVDFTNQQLSTTSSTRFDRLGVNTSAPSGSTRFEVDGDARINGEIEADSLILPSA